MILGLGCASLSKLSFDLDAIFSLASFRFDVDTRLFCSGRYLIGSGSRLEARVSVVPFPQLRLGTIKRHSKLPSE